MCSCGIWMRAAPSIWHWSGVRSKAGRTEVRPSQASRRKTTTRTEHRELDVGERALDLFSNPSDSRLPWRALGHYLPIRCDAGIAVEWRRFQRAVRRPMDASCSPEIGGERAPKRSENRMSAYCLHCAYILLKCHLVHRPFPYLTYWYHWRPRPELNRRPTA